MKNLGVCGTSLVFLVCGCGSLSPSESSQNDAVAQTAQALSSPATVLGFESASVWHGPGVLSSSSEHSEGSSSLAVQPQGYALYTSDRFAFPAEVRSIALDIELPAPAPPNWAGAVQMYLDCPTSGVWNAYLAQVELSGLPRGAFIPLVFSLPSALRSQLASGCEQMQLRLALNVPTSSPASTYLLDNLRLRGSLQLRYTFDSLSADGRVPDVSGYDRHGALQGAATLGVGRNGSGLSLDGVSAYLVIPDSLTDAIQELTITSWVKLDTQAGWSRLFDFGGSAGFAYLTPFTPDGLIRYSAFAGVGNEGTVTAPALPAGPWKHIAVTTRGRDYRVYVDGVEAANALTVPITPANIGTNSGNWIGRSRFPDPLLDGTVDDFRVYDRVLSQAEIQALATPGSDYANWRFDETSGSTAKDASELHLDGQIVGTPNHVQGIENGALALDGAGGYVKLPNALAQTCQDFTLSAWVKLRQNPAWNRVFDFGKPDFSSFMYLTPAGFGPQGQELHFGLITPIGIHDVGYPYIAPLAEWTHLGVVLRDQTASLFINGRAVTRQSGVISNPADMGATLGDTFGKSTFPADPTFAGSLDDIRMSCRAFADSELAQLAHLPAPAVLPQQLTLSGDITDVHDPSLIAAGGRYTVFSTGPGLLQRTSPDLRHWTFGGSVFAQNPAWVLEKFGNLDSLWAPDISFFGGVYHLYYAASTFGSNHSCIGHATKADLNSTSPWQDLGPVICSNDAGSVDDWNAIDPNVFVDASGTPWLSLGSFWSGLKLIQLDDTGARVGTSLVALATGPSTAVEAPYIVYHAPYYYLFASFDFCCRGVNSTYHVVVGRSNSLAGPYLDRTGLPMLQAGGTPVVNGDSRFVGPGHNAVVQSGGQWFNVYHSYDALNNGIPTLRISELVWQEGWPVSAEP